MKSFPTPTLIQPVLRVSYPPSPIARFAFVGDSGEYPYLGDTKAVADAIKTQNPEFVVHLGDCNYYGDPLNLHAHFTQYWEGWLDKMYITFGNHDLDYDYGEAILNVLPLPANLIGVFKRINKLYCYDFVRGPVHFFVFNTGDTNCGDHMKSKHDARMQLDKQFEELTPKIRDSKMRWKIAVFHKPPYTNAPNHPPSEPMRVDWKAMGIDVVLNGHCHNYEYIYKNGVHFFINGLGGALKHHAVTPYNEPDTVMTYGDLNGYSICEATLTSLVFKTYNVKGDLIDQRLVT